ncbi:Acetyl-CoA carboxylase [Phytophthora infestans]|uniref:Acetyl-CoA carboxylase n=1 Tax=Phytophthora infestans TaxID=4787 RepID=A0A8S9UYK3_PHYIN|nr:Acetyl-CoA carboxylase [Phytophthora infestans]
MCKIAAAEVPRVQCRGDPGRAQQGPQHGPTDFEASVLTLRGMYKDGLITSEEAVLTDLINEYFAVETAELGWPGHASSSDGAEHYSHVGEGRCFVPLFEKLASFKEKQYSFVGLELRQFLIDNKANIAEATANFLGQSQPLFDLASRPRRSADPGVGAGAVRTAHVPLAPHRVDGDDRRQGFPVQVACSRRAGGLRRPRDRGQAVAQAGRELLEHLSGLRASRGYCPLYEPGSLQERVHGRDDVVPAREQDVVGAQGSSCLCASFGGGEPARGGDKSAGIGQGVPQVSEPELLSHNIRLVTSVRPQNIENISSHNADMALYPNIYTFPGRLNYNEDKVVRQMEAPISYKLMPCRLQNYSVTPLASEVMNVQL